MIIIFGFLFSVFYPNIGTLLSYIGAVCGFVIVYVLPVMVTLAQSREDIQLKLRGQLDASNDDMYMPHMKVNFSVDSGALDNKSSDDDDNFRTPEKNKTSADGEYEARLWAAHYRKVAIHSLIPVYGAAIILV